MRIATTSVHEVIVADHRLDASYHASSGVQAQRFLHLWGESPQPAKENIQHLGEKQLSWNSTHIDSLADVCIQGGIFIPGRFRRYYVSDPRHGERWLSPSEMQRADLNDLPLVSRKYTPELEKLRIHQDCVLLSRSGTIGNAIYVRADMEGLIGSDDIIRIIADPARIQPGYLFGFISSAVGRALIEQKTYGAVVPHIEAHHIQDLPIPRLSETLEQQIHDLIQEAAKLRADADKAIADTRKDLIRELNLQTYFTYAYDHAFSVGASSLDSAHLRLDAFYHIGYAGEVKNINAENWRKLSEIGDEIFNPPVFTRNYVGTDGMPYLMGYEVYQLHPKATHYLSRLTKDLERYVLRQGMIAIQDAGQRYGLLGTPMLVNRTLDGCAATNNMIRLVFSNKELAGYVYAFLSTDVGQRLVLRESYGSSLPHILPQWLGEIPIPWPEEETRLQIGRGMLHAFEMRAEANDLEDRAQNILLNALGWEEE